MDRFADLQTFVHVVDAGSITAAADRLDIAKSAVSRRLAELEGRLGVQLFRRTTRKLSLTDTGRSFYVRAQRILEDLEEAELAVSCEHKDLNGRLRVAVPLTFGLHHLSPAISEFLRLHPGVHFDLDLNDRQVDLLQEGFDLAIRIADLGDSSLIARRLAPARSLVCASPEYLKEHGTPKTPGDLKKHQALVYSNLPDPGSWPYRAPDGSTGTVKVPIRFEANNGDMIRDAAEAGFGVVIAPTFIVYKAVSAGTLVPVLTDYQWPTVNAYAVYPRTRHLSTRVRTFVDFLAERFGDEPYWDKAISVPSPSWRTSG